MHPPCGSSRDCGPDLWWVTSKPRGDAATSESYSAAYRALPHETVDALTFARKTFEYPTISELRLSFSKCKLTTSLHFSRFIPALAGISLER